MRILIYKNAFLGGQFRREGLIGCFADFRVHFRFNRFQFLFVDDPFAHQETAQTWEWDRGAPLPRATRAVLYSFSSSESECE